MARMAKRKTRKVKRSKKQKKTRRARLGSLGRQRRVMKGGDCEQPDATYSYDGKYDCDFPICDENGEEIGVQTLGMYEDDDTRLPEGTYIYAIRASDPTEIYYMSPTDTYDCNDGSELEIYHSCLTGGEDVIAAGEIYVEDETYTITNKSGHYEPDAESLYYVKCLMEELGYPNVSMRYFNTNAGTTRTFNSNEGEENHYEYVFGSKWKPNEGEAQQEENW